MSDFVFSTANYRVLLDRLIEKGYAFESFPRAQEMLDAGERFILLRHDLDFEVESVLRMAAIEAECGVSSTYFFMVRTSHYNVFSEEGTRIIERIIQLGHYLGLHFDSKAYAFRDDVEKLNEACLAECEILAKWSGAPVTAVSSHRPRELELSGDPALTAPYLHAYMKLFTGRMEYCSDSRGEWRYGQPTEREAFRKGLPMHLLIHPIWWNDPPASPRETLERFCERRRIALRESVARNCTVFRAEGPEPSKET